jgi:hypothetical protein
MTRRAPTRFTTVIGRLDRTIQYAAADVGSTMPVIAGCPALAAHDMKE